MKRALWINVSTEGQFANRLFNRAHLAAAAIEHGAQVLDLGLGKYAEFLPNVNQGKAACYPQKGFFPFQNLPGFVFKIAFYILKKLKPRKTGSFLWFWTVVFEHKYDYLRPNHPRSVTLNSKHFEEVSSRRHVMIFDGLKLLSPQALLRQQEKVRDLFRLPDECYQYAAKVLAVCSPSEKRIGIHIRHADFATAAAGRGFFTAAEYATVARQILESYTASGQKARIVVCTDGNRDEITEAFGALSPILSGGNYAEDMAVLGSCDLIVGSDLSTYSTWAAWWHKKPLIKILRENFSKSYSWSDGRLVRIPWEYSIDELN